MFRIEFTDGAIEDLEVFSKPEQRQIVAAIEAQLTINPAHETQDRKRLHPSGFAEWEIRIRKIRVFYDIQNGSVKVVAIGKNFFINLRYFRRRARIANCGHLSDAPPGDLPAFQTLERHSPLHRRLQI